MNEVSIFELFSQLMDESNTTSAKNETIHLAESNESINEIKKHNAEMLEKLGDFRYTLDENLIPSIEKINYRDKFNIIRQLKELGNDISLYIFFPELLNKTAVCFYEPTKADLASLKNDIDADEAVIYSKIPTMYCKNSETNVVSCLNPAEKRIWFRREDYIQLIKESDEKDMEISGLAEAALAHADKMSASQIILTVPTTSNAAMKHRSSLCHSADVLVIRLKKLKKDVLEKFELVKHLVIVNKSNARISDELAEECKKRKLTPVYVNNISAALDELKKPQYNQCKADYSFKERMECRLYEIMWYLANRKKELNIPIKMINENLLYQSDSDKEVTEHINKLRQKYSDQIGETDSLYQDYKMASDKLENILDDIISEMNINDAHCSDADIIIDLIIKKSAAFSEYPVQGCREHIKDLCDRYTELTKDTSINALYNELIGKRNRNPVRSAFMSIDSESFFVKHKKIELCENIPEMFSDLANIALSLGDNIGNNEKRLIGRYYISAGDPDTAEKYLLDALENGDIMSGDIYFKQCRRDKQAQNNKKSRRFTDDDIKLADMGVGAAALKIGQALCNETDMNIYSSEDKELGRCLRYLKIAASQGILDAIKLLGDIYHDRYYLSTYDNKDKKAAIYYYALADSKGSSDTKMLEKLGSLYYSDNDFANCLHYCQRSETAASNYYIGLIYKNGNGVSKDRNQALTYLEKAASAGHAEAQVEYEKLNAEIAAEQAKTTTSSQTSYTSYSYYSGYYSSYYSGW